MPRQDGGVGGSEPKRPVEKLHQGVGRLRRGVRAMLADALPGAVEAADEPRVEALQLCT